MSFSRRKFLQFAGALLASGTLESCCLLTRKPRPICPFDPAFTDAGSMLAIDVHAHIFNATDLQVKDFVSKIAVGQSSGIGRLASFFGGLLQTFAWSAAPDVTRESRILDELEPLIMACDTGENVGQLRVLRQQKYFEGKAELDAAVQERMQELAIDPSDLAAPLESMNLEQNGLRQIMALPDSYEDLNMSAPEAEFSTESFPEAISIGSALKFIVEMFQYRFVSIYNYLETYSSESDIKIDLMTPAAVDFDWWISKGVPTRSRLPDQMALMKKISVLTGGRVHALVPFDPFRQAVHDLNGDGGFSPLELVKTSIDEYGAIGVKLYPPMGFAPFGNRQIGLEQPELWKQPSWLPEIASRDDFPERLDASLAKLYEYCAENGVPVMGHSNGSNGPSEAFEGLTSPPHWETAAAEFRDVSFSFGHFGGAGSSANDDESNARGFLNLMEADRQAGLRRIAADASYFSNILDDPARLETALRSIFEFGDSDPGPAIDRLMYGADWKMLVAETGSGSYLSDFSNVMARLQEELGITGLKDRFFGRNAAVFMGLARGRDNRARLENFYDRNAMARAPVWMDKVDKQVQEPPDERI